MAGTIIVARDDDDLQVLMMRRRPELRFMGGFWVFPGGAADSAEIAAGDALTAAAAAACRELHEEAGLTLSPSSLVRWAHWITPAASNRRFDTHFFLARSPAGQEPRLDTSEASDMRWVRPQDHGFLEQPGADFPITAPTQLVLRELAEELQRSGSLQALVATAPRRPIHSVVPKIEDQDVVMPWDPDYAAIDAEGIDWDTAMIDTRAGWPSRLPAHVAHPDPKPR